MLETRSAIGRSEEWWVDTAAASADDGKIVLVANCANASIEVVL
jgi:hypothetical protein